MFQPRGIKPSKLKKYRSRPTELPTQALSDRISFPQINPRQHLLVFVVSCLNSFLQARQELGVQRALHHRWQFELPKCPTGGLKCAGVRAAWCVRASCVWLTGRHLRNQMCYPSRIWKPVAGRGALGRHRPWCWLQRSGCVADFGGPQRWTPWSLAVPGHGALFLEMGKVVSLIRRM